MTENEAQAVFADWAMTAADGEPIGVEGRFRLHPDRPLGHLDAGTSRAFAVTDSRDPGLARYATLLAPGQPYRERVAAQFLQRPSLGTICPIGSGLVRDGGGSRLALVFERPEGGHLGQPGLALPEPEIVSGLLPPVFDAIEALAARRIAHRRIRPANLFFLDTKRTRIVLGECVSTPPALDQPRLFEPIDRALAMPEGRGEGTTGCDFYALGVSLACLVLGLDPANLDNDIALRSEQGSYVALVGRARLTPQMEELLHGLLADDPAGRWGLDEIRRWRSGANEVSRQRGAGRRAPYGYPFCGREWRMPRLLAAELGQHRREALVAIREPALELWIRHSLGDAAMADDLRRAVAAHQGAGGEALADDILITRVCRALDPQGPIRFRDLAAMEDGLAPVLSQAMASAERGRMKTIGDLFSGPLLIESTWTEGDGTGLAKPFALSLQSWVRDTSLGAGLERCLYEMSPNAPCYSPQLGGDGAMVPDILRALDRSIEDRAPARAVFDRHLAAFLASRSRMLDRRVIEIARNDRDATRQALAVVILFGELQQLFKVGPLRKLAIWAAAQLVPGVRSLRRLGTRQRLLDELPRLAVDGDLQKVVQGLDLLQVMREDAKDFVEARAEHRRFAHAIRVIEGSEAARAAAAFDHSQWISALIAVLCLGLSLGSVVLQAF